MSVVAEAKNELHVFERVATATAERLLAHIEKQDAEIERLREALKMAGTADQQLICDNGYTLGYVIKDALSQ